MLVCGGVPHMLLLRLSSPQMTNYIKPKAATDTRLYPRSPANIHQTDWLGRPEPRHCRILWDRVCLAPSKPAEHKDAAPNGLMTLETETFRSQTSQHGTLFLFLSFFPHSAGFMLFSSGHGFCFPPTRRSTYGPDLRLMLSFLSISCLVLPPRRVCASQLQT